MGNDILEFLATREVIIVLVILGIIIAAYVVLWFIEYMKKHEQKKKLQNNTMELNKLVREVHDELKKEGKELIKHIKEVNAILEFQLTSNVRLNNLNDLNNHDLWDTLK